MGLRPSNDCPQNNLKAASTSNARAATTFGQRVYSDATTSLEKKKKKAAGLSLVLSLGNNPRMRPCFLLQIRRAFADWECLVLGFCASLLHVIKVLYQLTIYLSYFSMAIFT